MKACHFLVANKEKILKRWEHLSIAKLPEAHKLSHTAIRDHIPQVFSQLCSILEIGVFSKPEELSKTHGRMRSWTTNYSLAEVIGEYSLLKNVIYDELMAADLAEMTDFRMIDRFFDSASSTAAVEFVAMRECELNALTDSLVTMNQDLETFAAVAAHDLRSPTSTILGYVDLITEESDDAGEISSQAVIVIKRTALRMLELIDQLLDYSKIGKEHLMRKSFSLETVAKEAVSNLAAHIQEVGATVEIEKMPDYMGDGILFRQLLQNLISNSLKFHAEGRACLIGVSASVNKNWLQLRVKDNGIGFEPLIGDIIFQPFKRGGQGGVKGSGLGLATAKKIVELHDGKISAVGRPGEGAEVLVELPLSAN